MKKSLLLCFALSSTWSLPAYSSDWGCEVLLCLSDPRGPTTENECVPPITKLWDQLKKGGSMPSCDMAGDSSYAKLGNSPFDLCPEGFKQIDAGQAVITTADLQNLVVHGSGRYQYTTSKNGISIGIGDGDRRNSDEYNEYVIRSDDGSFLNIPITYLSRKNSGKKICGKGYRGVQEISEDLERPGTDGNTDRFQIKHEAHVYDEIVTISAKYGGTIDVYIDNQIYKRVFW